VLVHRQLEVGSVQAHDNDSAVASEREASGDTDGIYRGRTMGFWSVTM
jgi:hypothetical protein